eukprot:1274358-Amphidinium_carterae.1
MCAQQIGAPRWVQAAPPPSVAAVKTEQIAQFGAQRNTSTDTSRPRDIKCPKAEIELLSGLSLVLPLHACGSCNSRLSSSA